MVVVVVVAEVEVDGYVTAAVAANADAVADATVDVWAVWAEIMGAVKLGSAGVDAVMASGRWASSQFNMGRK